MIIDFDILSYGFGLLLLLLLIVIMKKKYNKTNIYLVFYTIFFIYLLHVVKYTIFPIEIGTAFVEDMREQLSIFSKTNVIPFKSQNLEQTILNIVLTIPFGFGLPYLRKMNIKSIILWAIVFSFLIELTQFIVSLIIGYPYRVIDINDILANSLGALIGFLVFRLFSKVVLITAPILTKNGNGNLSSFLTYIINVAKVNYHN